MTSTNYKRRTRISRYSPIEAGPRFELPPVRAATAASDLYKSCACPNQDPTNQPVSQTKKHNPDERILGVLTPKSVGRPHTIVRSASGQFSLAGPPGTSPPRCHPPRIGCGSRNCPMNFDLHVYPQIREAATPELFILRKVATLSPLFKHRLIHRTASGESHQPSETRTNAILEISTRPSASRPMVRSATGPSGFSTTCDERRAK